MGHRDVTTRYYCKYCKKWLNNDKASRQLHDAADSHKTAVQDLIAAQQEKRKEFQAHQHQITTEVAHLNNFVASGPSATPYQAVGSDQYDYRYIRAAQWRDETHHPGKSSLASQTLQSIFEENERKEINCLEKAINSDTGYGLWQDAELDHADTRMENSATHGQNAVAEGSNSQGQNAENRENIGNVHSPRENKKGVNKGENGIKVKQTVLFKRKSRPKKRRYL